MTSEGMTSYQRVMAALNGDKPDRTPVFPMVREWCSKQVGFTFREITDSVEKYVFAQYYCARTYGYDGVKDFGGVNAESEAMGSKLKTYDDQPPSICEYAIDNYERDLPKLKVFNPYADGRMPGIIEGVRRLKEICRGRYPVDAYVQAPLRHAAMLRGASQIYKDMIKQKERLRQLLEITTYTQMIYGTALFHAGADLITISDPTSSGDTISRRQWEEFGFTYTKRLVNELKKTGVKLSMHVCGDTADRIDSFAQLGVDCLSLDYKVDLEIARKKAGDRICLLGNINPYNLAEASSAEIIEEGVSCIKKAGRNGAFILSSGCGVPAETPAENIRAMVFAAEHEVI
jgi:uroporphyrinogen decarboxylase